MYSKHPDAGKLRALLDRACQSEATRIRHLQVDNRNFKRVARSDRVVQRAHRERRIRRSPATHLPRLKMVAQNARAGRIDVSDQDVEAFEHRVFQIGATRRGRLMAQADREPEVRAATRGALDADTA